MFVRISERIGTRFHRYLCGIQVRFVKHRRGWFWFTLGWPTMQKEIGPFRTRPGCVKAASRFLNS